MNNFMPINEMGQFTGDINYQNYFKKKLKIGRVLYVIIK